MGNFATGITEGPRPITYSLEMIRHRRPPITQALVPVTPADTPLGTPGRNMEERLDEAIQETFPASDPIAVRIEGPLGTGLPQ